MGGAASRSVRDAVRGLLASPAYAIVAVLSIGGAVALGTSAAAVAAAIWFTASPFDDPGTLVQLWQTSGPNDDSPRDYLAPDRAERWVAAGDFRTVTGLAAASLGPTLIRRTPRGAERVEGSLVLGDWFGVVGTAPTRGRTLLPEDLEPGAPPVAVVSHALWRFDLGAGALGEMVLNGQAFTVVGVMPPTFEGGRKVWIPLEAAPGGVGVAAYVGLGRLAEGATEGQAAEEIQRRAALEVRSDSLRFGTVGATARMHGHFGSAGDGPALWLLIGIVAAVVILAMNNLTVLSLVRAQSRSGGMAVRAALGAGRMDLGLGLLIEGALVGGFGVILGLPLASWGKGFAAGLANAPELYLPFDGRLVVVALLLGGGAAVVVGAVPLQRLGALNLGAILKRRSGGSMSTRGERRIRQTLVGAQIAISVVLVALAGVLGVAYRSFAELDVGVDAHEVVEARPDWGIGGMSDEEAWTRARAIADRVGVDPTLEATAWRSIGMDYPPRPASFAVTDGPEVELGALDGLYRYLEVLPGFFTTLGVEIVQGRPLTPGDGRDGAVAVITKRGADLFWPGLDPIGRRIRLGSEGAWMTIVGVSEDIRQINELGRAVAMADRVHMPLLFLPQGQFPTLPAGWREFECCSGIRVGARSEASPAIAAERLRRTFGEVAPDLPLETVGTIRDIQMAGYYGRNVATMGRLVGFGVGVALFLSLIGIAGIVVESVVRRTREVGVRVALGARPVQVSWTVARESMIATGIGLLAGVAALHLGQGVIRKFALPPAATRLGPELSSPGLLLAAVALVASIGAASLLLTSRRAHAINPIDALRAE